MDEFFVGKKVRGRPSVGEDKPISTNYLPRLTGEIVYINQAHRYYTVAWKTERGIIIHESYGFVQWVPKMKKKEDS